LPTTGAWQASLCRPPPVKVEEIQFWGTRLLGYTHQDSSRDTGFKVTGHDRPVPKIGHSTP
jgi:hypothetical protein